MITVDPNQIGVLDFLGYSIAGNGSKWKWMKKYKMEEKWKKCEKSAQIINLGLQKHFRNRNKIHRNNYFKVKMKDLFSHFLNFSSISSISWEKMEEMEDNSHIWGIVLSRS